MSGNASETYETDVLIIGGGVTGAGVMRDLAMRGVHCILIDRKDLNAGASGGNHGLLHSGGRYAMADADTAAECQQESEILKRVASHCIDDCGGIFAAVEGDDREFVDLFPERCKKAGINCQALSPAEARELEPALSDAVFAAFTVPDATVDPFRLTLENVSHAQQLTGSQFLAHTELGKFDISGGVIHSAICTHLPSGHRRKILAKQFVNAAGAWAKGIAAIAGCMNINLLYSKGTLIISNTRIADRVINRLRPAGDGDILVPGGTVSLLGTTSSTESELDNIRPQIAEVERNLHEARALIPALASTRFIRAFSGVRPLLLETGSAVEQRQVSRGFKLFDHQADNVANLASIVGGKLTTFRLMAEKTADLVAQRLGNPETSKTTIEKLPTAESVKWSNPGFAARDWYRRQDSSDSILCECEMVPQSAIDVIIQSAPGIEGEVSMQAISVRCRAGKGSCQGSFCSIRINSHLYDKGIYNTPQGLHHLRRYVSERFNGVRPVIWGEQMAQTELAEALHCGLLGLDLLEQPSGNHS